MGPVAEELGEPLCPCGSQIAYAACCGPFHAGKAKPATAEQLMRSRFSAYVYGQVDYLVETTHPNTRESDLKRKLESNMDAVEWSLLTMVSTSQGGPDDKVGKVEFIADYYVNNEKHQLRERSRFKRFEGIWTYWDNKG